MGEKIDEMGAGECGLHCRTKSINMWLSSGACLCISHSNYLCQRDTI